MPHNQGILVTLARLHNGEIVKIFNLRPSQVQILIEERENEKLLCVDGELKNVCPRDIKEILGEEYTKTRFISPEFRRSNRQHRQPPK